MSRILLPGEDPFPNPEPQRRPSGMILEGDRVVADTLQCVHCQRHWVPVRGSKKRRGFCRNCMGPLCGRKECMRCAHYEKKIEQIEKGRRSSY